MSKDNETVREVFKELLEEYVSMFEDPEDEPTGGTVEGYHAALERLRARGRKEWMDRYWAAVERAMTGP